MSNREIKLHLMLIWINNSFNKVNRNNPCKFKINHNSKISIIW